MLFYGTEGKFGEDDFKVTAKSLFLLDIGTQSYTEYDPADPDLIKFLMANPEALMLKKGHIHSHNNMGVFFSGTDNEELVDNSGFHNFYLSLIVNNRNEMCAKIAFKAKTQTDTTVTINFLDESGRDKKKKWTSSKEGEAIYVYKCDVIKSTEAVGDSFTDRFQELKVTKDKRDAEAATIKEKALKGSFNVDERWKQALLFEGIGSLGMGKTTDETKDKKRASVMDRETTGRVDINIYSMLTKLVSLDPLYEGTLGGVLKKLDAELYPSMDYGKDDPSNHPCVYYDAVMARASDFYTDAFPEDLMNLTNFNSTMEKAVVLLETYETQFPELIANLKEVLTLEIK